MTRVIARMGCGHLVNVGESAPRCPECGDARVAFINAPAPKFRGVVLGPCATYEDLPAKPVTLKENT